MRAPPVSGESPAEIVDDVKGDGGGVTGCSAAAGGGGGP